MPVFDDIDDTLADMRKWKARADYWSARDEESVSSGNVPNVNS